MRLTSAGMYRAHAKWARARVWGGCVGGRARHVGLMGMPMWPMAVVQAVDFVVLVGRLLTLLYRPS